MASDHINACDIPGISAADAADRPGSTLWVCMIVPLLRKAAKEIRKLREESERPGLFKGPSSAAGGEA